MKLVSTRGHGDVVDLRTAVFSGLAPDGGLYLPETVAPLADEALHDLRGRSLPEVATRVARHLIRDEFTEDDIGDLVESALNFPIPLVPLADGSYVLELFRGPTGSFKDVGARFLAGLVGRFRAEMDQDVIVLVATSGDTGGAVAHAFHEEPGVRTVVLFPEGKVSPVQRKQLTEVGGNVESVAVRGTFDDCQRLVKKGIADRDLQRTAVIASANSINVGRLLPQSFYYFHAWGQLPDPEPAPVFSVPSGNLGNLTGGALARFLGLPAAGFLAATNVNDTVARFLETGELDPNPAVQTLSSAMDVARPNNLERLLSLYSDDWRALSREVRGSSHTDHETLEAIRRVYEEQGYLMDPHTAVGWLALTRARERGGVGGPDGATGVGDARGAGEAPGIVLSTASPAKFPETVERATGIEP
ncbi:MAG: threonine synthase, partial [bacterium]